MQFRNVARTRVGLGLVVLMVWTSTAWGQVALPGAKPVPLMQVIPLDGDRASFQRDGVELTVYHFGVNLKRPFLFPVNGASGRSLTRMGHPHDPVGHSHHNSVWFAHNDVGGENFWLDTGVGRVLHRRIVRFDDGDDAARVVTEADWIGQDNRVRLRERRGITVRSVDKMDMTPPTLNRLDWLLVLDLQLENPTAEPVTLGPTPFGLVGVWVAKPLGIRDGGGLVRNSQGQTGETGPNNAFRKPARWMDYSGLIASGRTVIPDNNGSRFPYKTSDSSEGVTLFDHPANPHHPAPFHVRADGWMGACLNIDAPLVIAADQPLRVRYGLLVHNGVPTATEIESRWQDFASQPVGELPTK